MKQSIANSLNNMWFILATSLLLLLNLVAGFASAQELATQVALEEIRAGLGSITDIVNAGDNRLFVVTREAFVRVIQFPYDSGTISTFLDISSLVYDNGAITDGSEERGLLGLAFHPDYANNGYFFVNYVNNDVLPGNTVIARYSVSTTDPNVADPNSELVIAEIQQPYANHNGGQLQFWGGYLYVATGDGGSAGDPENNGQDKSSLLGKILRVDVDNLNVGGSLPIWNIPSDNPFVSDPSANDAIWAYGLRNPWRFTFDRNTGDMWIADVGQASREEVNFQSFSSTGGENYGWRPCEGTFTYNSEELLGLGCSSCTDTSACGLVKPVLEYTQSTGNSIIGGYVYRGSQYASQLGGTYFYADFATNILWGALPNVSGGFEPVIELSDSELSSPTTFGEDQDGEVYVATLGGALYRIKPSLTSPPPTVTPTSAPPSAPIPPTTVTVDCPDQYDESLSLAANLDMAYAIRIPTDPAEIDSYGGILCVQLVYQGIGWVAFGISTDENMIGSDAIIGLPDSPVGPDNPGKYDLYGKNMNLITLMPRQTLLNSTIEQSGLLTTLTFTKILKEPGEIEIDGTGINTFLYATGSDNSFTLHNQRGSFFLDLTPLKPCVTDSDCGPPTFCNPGKCDASFFCERVLPPCLTRRNLL